MDTLRIGLIGCGGRSRFHIAGLNEVENVRIVAVCDLDSERAKERAEPLGAAVYTDVEDMLNKEQLDGVCIATAALARGGPEIACAQAGVPFLVEKPVAVDMETAHEVAAHVRASGVITSVGYQLRYGGTSRAVWEWSKGKRIGMAEGRYWCGAARARRRTPPGQLLEQVTHTFDLMRFWIGDVEEVFSYQALTLLDEGDMPDVHAVAMRFVNGAVATVSSTWGSHPRASEANVVNLFAGDEYVTYGRSQVTQFPDGPMEPVEGPTIHEAFVTAIRTGDSSPILTPYEDAVKSLAVSIAADESARVGRPIRVADLLGDAAQVS